MHNVEVALELIIDQTNTSITTTKSSSAKLMGVRAVGRLDTSAQAGRNPRVLRSSSCHADFRANPAKP